MELTRAFRIEASTRLALVGAGGKTSALFQLAREWVASAKPGASKTTLLTTTTHLGTWQLSQADHHIVLRSPEDVDKLSNNLPYGVVLLSGPEIADVKVSGLSDQTLGRVKDMADDVGIPLLIEADGSRLHPLKAPASHEPPIPDFVDTVVVVAGLSGLGEKLSAEVVHRPESFTSLSGLSMGETITPGALTRVLSHPEGGMKNVPPDARVLVLMNQASQACLAAVAARMAGDLVPPFHGVVVADLDRHLAGAGRVFALHEPIAGIVLAAGESTRFGEPKQLLPWGERPLVWHVAQRALEAGLAPVVVVSGAHTPEIRLALAGLPVSLVYNPDPHAGQSASIQAGLRALPDRVGGVVFLLADQPQIPVDLVRKLVETHSQTRGPLVASQVDGQRANPVLFDRETFLDFLALRGDTGGRALFSKFPVTWVPWHDDRPLMDVDTPEDYRRLLEIEP
jgi:molybdenum cofactor cytidylyltransferase